MAGKGRRIKSTHSKVKNTNINYKQGMERRNSRHARKINGGGAQVKGNRDTGKGSSRQILDDIQHSTPTSKGVGRWQLLKEGAMPWVNQSPRKAEKAERAGRRWRRSGSLQTWR